MSVSRKQFEKYIEEFMRDERSFATFQTHTAFALIGANWVVLQASPQPVGIYISASLVFAVVFLIIRGIRHRLNIASWHRFIDQQTREQERIRAVHRKTGQGAVLATPYSGMGAILRHVEFPLLVLSASFLVSASVLAILQVASQ